MTVGIDNSCLLPGTYSISAVKYAALCRQFTGIKEKEEKKKSPGQSKVNSINLCY